VQVRTLRKGVDEFLVMGTDGLWDMVSSQEAIDIAGAALRRPGGSPAEASEALIEEALKRAVKAHGLTVQVLKQLKAGRARRSKHDDISLVVIDLARLVDQHFWG
jgi:serine/threonine protein phosphatase PrpC